MFPQPAQQAQDGTPRRRPRTTGVQGPGAELETRLLIAGYKKQEDVVGNDGNTKTVPFTACLGAGDPHEKTLGPIQTGVKVHVIGNRDNAIRLLNILLPVVAEKNAEGRHLFRSHKWIINWNYLKEAGLSDSDPTTEDQKVKLLTVYPVDVKDMEEIVQKLDKAIRDGAEKQNLPCGKEAGVRCPKADAPQGVSGYVSIRHGAYHATGEQQDATKAREARSPELQAYVKSDKKTTEGLFVRSPK